MKLETQSDKIPIQMTTTKIQFLSKPLEAQENLTEDGESDWTTPYITYMTHKAHRTTWTICLPKEERALLKYRSQFFILNEGELHRIFHNGTRKECMPGRYVRSYIKTLHIKENRHYSINSTKQLVLQGPYWWPTIAEDISILITLCTECKGQGEELPKEGNPSGSSNAANIIPYKETFNDWQTPLVEYMAQGEFKLQTKTQRGQRETVRDREHFTLENGKLRKIEECGRTKICIANYQIKHWIAKMHVFQQRHLGEEQTWLRCLYGNRWWPTMGFFDVQLYILYDCPFCRGQYHQKPKNIICGSISAQNFDHNDWRNPLIEYLTHRYSQESFITEEQHKRMARQSQNYFIEEGNLKNILSKENIKICIGETEVNEYLQELHITETGEHLSLEVTWNLVMLGPYWWPTSRTDIKTLCIWKCSVCMNRIKDSKDKQNQLPPRPSDSMKKKMSDWRRPHLEYLTCQKIFNQDLTPEGKRAVEQSHKYFVFTNGTLRRIRKGGKENQVRIPEAQVPMYLARIHEQGRIHLTPIETWRAIAARLYWWPTWGNDIGNYLRNCNFCRKPGNCWKKPLSPQN